jgi:hypothetical protein
MFVGMVIAGFAGIHSSHAAPHLRGDAILRG